MYFPPLCFAFFLDQSLATVCYYSGERWFSEVSPCGGKVRLANVISQYFRKVLAYTLSMFNFPVAEVGTGECIPTCVLELS